MINSNTSPTPVRTHIKSMLNNALEFNAQAIEIVILDRLGKAIWKTVRKDSQGPIHWDGRDHYGNLVTSGSLMCKITYADKEIIYVPFVFIQK